MGARRFAGALLSALFVASCGGGYGGASPSGGATLTSIAVMPDPIATGVGISQQLSAQGTFSDGSTADLTASATWTVTTTTVASVSGGGLVTGQAVGSTTISAMMDSVTGSTPLTVTASGSWHPAGELLGTRVSPPTAIVLADGKVFVGGGDNNPYAELYDPASQSSSALAAPATVPRSGGETLTLLGNGKILKSAGAQSTTAVLATAELFDPATNTWTAAADLTVARAGHTATLLPSGMVLVAGGGDGTNSLASAELYDPATNTWSSAGSLSVARSGHTATLLPSGRVLVAGGVANTAVFIGADPTNVTATAELYDPSTNIWSPAASMASPRNLHTATLLGSGSVLVAGGYSLLQTGVIVGPIAAEVYDPLADAWTPTNTFADNNARMAHTATLLANGMVLAAGGFVKLDPQSSATAELFDPGTGSWSATGDMTVMRAGHAAVLLPNSVVLVIGGDFSGSLPSTCEEYW